MCHLFDVDNTGTINPVDLQVALKNHGFDNKNPIVYNMIAGIDGKELEKVNFGEFLDLLASEGVDSSSSEANFLFLPGWMACKKKRLDSILRKNLDSLFSNCKIRKLFF